MGAGRLGGALRRRIEATRRVWGRGGAHMRALEPLAPDGRRARPGAGGGAGRAPIAPRIVVDSPAAGATVERGVVCLRGWALFESGPATRIEMSLGDSSLGLARLGLPRPDVGEYADSAAGAVAGFDLIIDLAGWEGEDGETILRAVAHGAAGERAELDPLALRIAPVAAAPASAPRRPPLERARRHGRRRVLVYTHQLDLGGAQLYLFDLIRGLLALGRLELTVVAQGDGRLRDALEQIGVAVHVSTPIPGDNVAVHAGRVAELAAWAATGSFDVALVNTVLAFAGVEAATALGVPVVWAIHESYEPEVLWSTLEHPLAPEVRESARAALAATACGLFEADATRALYEPLIGAARCITRPYGLDLGPIDAARAQFDPAAARRALSLSEDALVLMCVGTIEPRKAQVPLVQAFGLIADRHPRAQLVFVGAREDRASRALAEYVRTCAPEGRVLLVGVTSDMDRWYGLADVLVCASDVESLPRSVLEAMAWETPVLATNVFGLPELIEDGETGWLCEPRDVEALAAGLDRALGTPAAERARIGGAGRALVESRHRPDAYAREVAELLEQAVTSTASGPVDVGSR